MQVELTTLKRKKSPLAAQEVAYVLFFQNPSCFRRSNKPYSCAWFFPSSSFTAAIPTLPCPLPNAADAGQLGEQSPGPGELRLPTSWPGPPAGPMPAPSCRSFLGAEPDWGLPSLRRWLERTLQEVSAFEMSGFFNLGEIGLFFFKREMKTGRHSVITDFLFPCANRIMLYARYSVWPRVALAVSRLDAPMCLIPSVLIYWLFLWSPFIAPWHRLLARAQAVLLLAGDLGGCQARAWFPAARAFQGSLQRLSALIAACSRFPLSAVTVRLGSGSRAQAVFQRKGVPASFYFSCWRTDFSDLGVWDFAFVFTRWAFSLFSPHWFLYMHILQMFLSLSEVK